MKSMKKLLAITLVLVMLTALGATAFAATITVEDCIEGETYDAYKLLEYTSSGDAYSYYLDTSATNYAALKALLEACDPAFAFTLSSDGTKAFVNNSEALTGKGKEIADYLYTNLATLKTIALDKSEGNVADDSGEVEIDDLAQGYWFVTSSLGSLCTLQSYDDEELVFEKNSVLPPPDKEVDEASASAQVGDEVEYTVTLTDVKGTNKAAFIIDTMDKGLDYSADAVLTATIGGAETPMTKGTDYKETVADGENGTTIVTWEISAAFMTTMQEEDTIEVVYHAVVNDTIAINGLVINTPVIHYSEQILEGEPVEVPTTYMELDKVDSEGNRLKGAQFKLYRTDTNAGATKADVKLTEITTDIDAILAKYELTKAADTVYYIVDPEGGTNLIDMAQKDESDEYLYSAAVVIGLDKQSTYFLEETQAPEGYNQLDEMVEVSLAQKNLVEVENNAGTVLPSTGGIGTTLFYVIGTILVLGAGVVLVTKRRVRE